jgi:DNA-binding MarR family transcriptional regulator
MFRAKLFPHAHRQIERGVSAFRALTQAVRLAEAQRSRRIGNGLTPAQLSIIQDLALRPGQSVNDLAAATHTHQTTVSVILRNLHDAGLVEKRRGADNRQLRIRLTARGRRLSKRAKDSMGWPLRNALHGLSAEDRDHLVRILTELAKVAKAEGSIKRNPRAVARPRV